MILISESDKEGEMTKEAYVVMAELPGGGSIPLSAIVGAKTILEAKNVLKEKGPKHRIFVDGRTVYYQGPKTSPISCWLTRVPLLRLRKSQAKAGEKHE